MDKLQILASPWWVNLAVLVPLGSYFLWHKKGLNVSWSHIVLTAIFAIAFGINEAVVVVYLRAAVGLLPNFATALSQTVPLDAYQQQQLLEALPQTLILVEIIRETATIIVLGVVAWITAREWRERWAFFLWMFAFWDIFYYIGLWAIVRWPYSLLTPDILFLIPVPWVAQIWFPALVSLLAIAVLLIGKRNHTAALEREKF